MGDDRAIRFGVLGAARIVPKALLQPAREIPEVEVVAIAARDPARARQFAALHQIPRVLPTYFDLVNAPELDAIYVPLPNSMHCEWSIRALRAGKHVLCEKPIACNAIEAEMMARTAGETRLVLSEGFHYQYHPLAVRIRDLICSGEIGELLRTEAEFSTPIAPPNIRYDPQLGGGATMDLGCYALNMIRYFCGSTPQVRRAVAATGPADIDRAMEAELVLPGGARASMKCSMAPDTHSSVFFAARGSRGELHVTNPVAPALGHVLTLRRDARETQESVPGASTFVYQLRAFVAVVRGGAPLLTNPAEAMVNMRLIDEVYLAAGLRPRGSDGPDTAA